MITSGHTYAILVGINQYENFHQLNFAIQDIESLSELLLAKDRGGYQDEEVKILTDKGDNRRPHRSNIMDIVQTTAQSLTPDDSILFYFAGHGFTHKGKIYLAPIDGRDTDPDNFCIGLEWIENVFRTSL